MSPKRKAGSSVFLPWEGRNAFFQELLSGKRWRSVALIALTASAMVGAWQVADRRAKVRTTRAAIAEVERAVRAFRAEIGRCPHSTVELVHPPRAGAEYLDELPRDGWGRALQVRCPGRRDRSGSDVVSAGPSGSLTRDDNIY